MVDALESCVLEAGVNNDLTGESRLRVLAVIPFSPERSSMVFIKRQIASLQSAGISCRSFELASRTSPRILFREWRRLRKEIASFRPDFVHAHYGTMTALLTVLSTSLPVVITFRGSDLNPYRSPYTLRQRVARLMSQVAALRADRIICVSNQLKERLWWRRDRVSVIPSGVETKVFFPRPRFEARKELGWRQDESVVLFNAGTAPLSKRLDLALSSVESARATHGNIRLAVLDCNYPPEIIPIMMNAADCLLLTSDWEGSPNVVKEAIACNLPVVTVDAGDVRERLALVEPSRIVARNTQEIAAGIVEILSIKQRSNGVTQIQKLSEEKVANHVASVYRAMLRAR